MSSIFVGIDPGVKTGFAIWFSKPKIFTEISTLSFWGTIKKIDQCADEFLDKDLKFYIEAPHKNPPIFPKHLDQRTIASAMKIAQNVGENKCMAKLIVKYLQNKKVNYSEIQPTKRSLTKMNAEVFKKMTKWEERTSEHGRDAACLVWGR